MLSLFVIDKRYVIGLVGGSESTYTYTEHTVHTRVNRLEYTNNFIERRFWWRIEPTNIT